MCALAFEQQKNPVFQGNLRGRNCIVEGIDSEKLINYNAEVVNNLSEIFVMLIKDAVCSVAFGRKFSENQKSGVVDFKELLGVFNIGDFIPRLARVNRYNGLNERLKKVAKRFDLLLKEILMHHMDRLNRTGIYSEDENKAKDFVDVLLEFRKKKFSRMYLQQESIRLT
ncbi:Cytochrome P450 71A2 [Bienertia sinuspersici]